MPVAYLVPEWFFGYDIIAELIFALITFFIGLYSFKIYKLTGQKQSQLFCFSFLFISLAYILQSFLNFALLYEINEQVVSFLQLKEISTLVAIELYTYIIFYMIGLITLTYMTLKIKSKRVYSLLILLTLTSLIISSNKLLLFGVISSILLAYICIHYVTNYLAHKQRKTLLVAIAFALLFLSTIHFNFSINHYYPYFGGHILALFAYSLLLTNLLLVIKR